MGTTQTRIDDPSRFFEATASYLDRKITVVLKDSRVLFGNLVSRQADALSLTDMRNKQVQLPFSSISEIFLDSNF